MPLRLFSVSLSVLLASCSTTHYAAPSSAQELTGLVLVIRESPDGEVSHSWQRAEEFDLSRFRHLSRVTGTAGRIVLATDQQPDCDAQYLECHHQCLKAPVPTDFNQYLYDFGPVFEHERYCSEKCMNQYMKCLKEQGRRHKEFTVVDDAVDWLKRNRLEAWSSSQEWSSSWFPPGWESLC